MKIKIIFFTLTVCFLSACNGGTSGEDGSISGQYVQPQSIEIKVAPSQIKAMVNELTQVEVIAGNDENVELHLTSVKPISQSIMCQVIEVDGLTFTTHSDTTGECRYEYMVEPVNSDSYVGSGTSITRVSVSYTAEENTLPNLSETTNVVSPVTIDLSQELEGFIDTSTYTVLDEVILVGPGSAEVDSQNNAITYIPMETAVVRIMYSMSDGSVTKLGNIDIAVSDIGNTPPVAEDFILEGTLSSGMTALIDLSDYVSDAEDDVQLDSVRAYNAETHIVSSTDHTFTFESAEGGVHHVAYTVTDGRGGYAVGQVHIEVERDYNQVQGWNDIVTFNSAVGSDLTFTAPVSKAMADYTNTDYISYQIQDGNNGPENALVVAMNLKQANDYCASRGGRLPISREWELVLDSHGNLFDSKNWPTGGEYWSADMLSANTGRSFNAMFGSAGELDKESQSAFVTCVLLNSELINDFNTDLEIDYVTETDPYTVGLVGGVTDPDGNIAPYQDVTLVSHNQYGVFSNESSEAHLSADASGEIHDWYTDTAHMDEVITAYTSSNSLDTIVYDSSARVASTELIAFGDQKPDFELASDEENSGSSTVLLQGELGVRRTIDDYGFILASVYEDYTTYHDPDVGVDELKVSVKHNSNTPQGRSFLNFYGHDTQTGEFGSGASWNPVIFFELDTSKIDAHPNVEQALVSFRFKIYSQKASSWSSLPFYDSVAIFAGLDSGTNSSFGNSNGQGRNDFGFGFNHDDYSNVDGFQTFALEGVQNVMLSTPDNNGWRIAQATVPISSNDRYLRLQVRFEQSYGYRGSFMVDDIRANLVLE